MKSSHLPQETPSTTALYLVGYELAAHTLRSSRKRYDFTGGHIGAWRNAKKLSLFTTYKLSMKSNLMGAVKFQLHPAWNLNNFS